MNDLPLPIQQPDSSSGLQQRLNALRTSVQADKGMDQAKLKKACQDFEAVFIGQLWKQMRSSVPQEGLLHSKEEESYASMFDQELSLKMARSGGMGLGDMLYDNLSRRLVDASRQMSSVRHLAGGAGAEQNVAAAAAMPAAALATRTAQHEADQLALQIEQQHGGQPAVAQAPRTPSALDDALEMVRMDDAGGDI